MRPADQCPVCYDSGTFCESCLGYMHLVPPRQVRTGWIEYTATMLVGALIAVIMVAA